MKKTTHLIVLALLATVGVQAQSGDKKVPTKRERPAAEKLTLRPEAKRNLPLNENTFGIESFNIKTGSPLQRVSAASASVLVDRDANGTPICYRGATDVSRQLKDNVAAPADAALAYVASLPLDNMEAPATEFVVSAVQTDEQGNHHVRLTQQWNGVPVYGSEVVAHSKNGVFEMMNGRYAPSPKLPVAAPAKTAEQAIETVKNHLGADKVKTDWSALDLTVIGKNTPFEAQLVVYKQRYAWHIEAHPNLMQRVVYFVDAQTGDVLHHYDQTCRLHAHTGTHDHGNDALVNGPVTGTGTDLLGVSRTFGAWQEGASVYMEDASQPMFNSASQMPDEPMGAIVTLDAKNTSPEVSQSFDFDFVKSGNTTFNNTAGVSAHWNSIKSYQYFKNKFNRNSIDGNGGNIIAFINVAENDGSSMENAFWNGAAMWYGNGGSTFRKLARGLDVGGHEMSHGVIEKTANLEYQDESGALNESFADIFGAMIDEGDWQIGEDVMQPNTHTCLRDMANPNNGVSQSSPFWQPNHVNQQYFGNQDNGGVHINSGITNRAYYLFATNAAVGTAKAEQVYYKALRDYLTKSSKFVDCRIAVLQAANELYGSAVANAAASAFDQVGIAGSTPSGNYLGQLSANPGTPLIICTSDDDSRLDLADGNGNVLGAVYNTVDIESRPSISDNGATAVFVNTDKHLILLDFSYANGQINVQSTQISNFPEWRNAAISKDGRFVAGITDAEDNNIYVFDLLLGGSETFELYNPTYTQGQSTGDVLYPDVMEFDYSGEYIMYDAFNELSNTTGQSFTYWDIGFVKFWENGAFTDGTDAPIAKLFSGLPEDVSIGNPTFAKNSPYIVAFDYRDASIDEHNVLGANVETGDYDVVAGDIGFWGWPNYDMEDKSVLHNRSTNSGGINLVKQGVTSSKITQQGTAQTWIVNHGYGVWYGTGTRSLSVGTNDNIGAGMELTAAPNPSNGDVRVRFQMPVSAEMRVSVVNILGAMVHQYTVQATEGNNYFDLDLSTVPAGTYVLRLESPAGWGTVKVVKQ